MNFFSNPPAISTKDYILKDVIWKNHATGESKKIKRFINGYDKGLLKANLSDKYWDLVIKNCDFVKKELEGKGGFFYSNFHILPEDRSQFDSVYPVSEDPISLKTVFVSGFLFPQDKITNIDGGFYIKGEKSPSLDELTKQHIPQKHYPILLFNLGYYYTKQLLDEMDYGYNEVRRSKHLYREILGSDCLPFLGGSVWKKSDRLIINPPLFNKSVILFSKEGRVVIIKNWMLEDGSVDILGKLLSWKKKDVNNFNSKSDIQIFTPFIDNRNASLSKRWKNYNVFVGNGRVNFLIISKGTGKNPESFLVKIKKGKILMPSMGMVISLDENFFTQNFKENFPGFDESGFIRLKVPLKVSFKIGVPIDMNFYDTSFGYGGFLPLVLDGNNFTKSPDELEKLMFDQGFFHPFSRQSQETPIEKPYEREPRAVFVVTENSENKEEYGFFSFSGRYENSVGISIFEIVPLLKQILKTGKIKFVIHLDSGSAVKLMYLQNKQSIRILNLTALSMRSFTGEYTENVYNLINFSV